ncbi:type I-E CRISPR-associated protein Cse1/CasA [Actinokineospora terrae]|nr:type I-E CRISPR-associated protein Cse1/CasA [Actinokineospora terrae]
MNLLDDPWIPVQLGDSHIEVSGRDAILRSNEIAQLTVTAPTMMAVILRQFLLPVVMDALGVPQSAREWPRWMRLFTDGSLSSQDGISGRTDGNEWSARKRQELADYFAEHHDSFELFHPERPFAQVADLRTTNNDTKSTSLLIPSVASGNNVPLFSTRLGDAPWPLTPAEAARWLLHAQCWDTAAIKTGVVGDKQAKNGKTTGNPTGPLGQLGMVIPVGRTLAETLVLNLPIVADGLPESDRPQWRRGPWTPVWAPGRAMGRLELLTWQSRRIRLHTAGTPDGVRVTSVVLSAGDRLIETPLHEPHTVWNVDPKPKAGVPPVRPRRHSSGRAAWRGLDALLALGEGTGKVRTSRQLEDLAEVLDQDFPLQVFTVGVEYGNQSAVVENVIADSLPLPVAALREVAVRDALIQIAEQADDVAKAVNLLSADLRRAAGCEPLPWDKGQRPGDRLLHALDPSTRRVLGKLRTRSDPDAVTAVHTAWEQVARRTAFEIAEPLLCDASPRQFAGVETEHNKKKITHCSPRAELSFHKRIRDALPLAAAINRRDPDQEV